MMIEIADRPENRQSAREQAIERIERLGLDVTAVWHPTPDEPELEIRQLKALEQWIIAYWSYDGRKGMEKHGLDYPPVQPCIDPETDWLRFERWMDRKPLQWNLHREAARIWPSEQLTDEEIECYWQQMVSLLEQKEVLVEFSERIPVRIRYDHLRTMLLTETFEHVAPGTRTHLTGCDGWCEECFQAPWCEVRAEFEDAEETVGVKTP